MFPGPVTLRSWNPHPRESSARQCEWPTKELEDSAKGERWHTLTYDQILHAHGGKQLEHPNMPSSLPANLTEARRNWISQFSPPRMDANAPSSFARSRLRNLPV